MDYVSCAHIRCLTVVVLTTVLTSGAATWQRVWRPNYVSDHPEYLVAEVFDARNGTEDNFKLLRVEGNRVFIGSRNHLFHLQFGPFKSISELNWPADETVRTNCFQHGRAECDNYIRVMVLKDSDNAYYICGTYAYAPKCRYYKIDSSGSFTMISDNESGTGISPFNPNHNSTAIYNDGKMFTATVSSANERDSLILQKYNDTHLVRTQNKDSLILNEPHFVSSDHKHDKVFFFFREVAVENINCGKAVFSRVARVCKNDHWASKRQNIFTSYFKARLNCSIPGEYPFYFDEIESATEFGQGNHRPTSDSGDRADMVYGVFNTPDNSIRGSAVCAFRYSAIEETFGGRFKGQESYKHNWLPISWDDTPRPHPAVCPTKSDQVSHLTMNFVKRHPLMDEAVPAAGGMPMLVFTSFWSKFTQIAVDWQVLAADGNYYDVMFVGTDDGRVIKAINKGTEKVESVVIEDIQVLDVGDPVVSLKVLSHRTDKDSLLVVASRRKVVSIPVHRCHRALTCSTCVAIQDPYCVWNDDLKCINAQIGVQSISTGKHPACKDNVIVKPAVTSAPVLEEKQECSCPNGSATDGADDGMNERIDKPRPYLENREETDNDADERLVSASTTAQDTSLAIEIVIVAVIVSIIGSLILGFFIGFTFQACRYAREKDNVFDRNYSSLQRGRNRLSSGDNPYFHTDHSNLTPKQMNYMVNPGKMNSMETKPMTKPNKVYV